MQLLLETFFILRRNQRDVITDAYRSSRRFSETAILSAGLKKKSSNLKFHEDLSRGSRVVQQQDCSTVGLFNSRVVQQQGYSTVGLFNCGDVQQQG